MSDNKTHLSKPIGIGNPEVAKADGPRYLVASVRNLQFL